MDGFLDSVLTRKEGIWVKKQGCLVRLLEKNDCESVLPYIIAVVWKMRWTGRWISFSCFLLRTCIRCSLLAGFRIKKMEWRIPGRIEKKVFSTVDNNVTHHFLIP